MHLVRSQAAGTADRAGRGRALSVAGPPALSLADWVRQPENENLRVAEINRIDGLHSFVETLPFFSGSDFEDDSGNSGGDLPVHSEDLTCLSYAENSFDLILTSETLEHVPGFGPGPE